MVECGGCGDFDRPRPTAASISSSPPSECCCGPMSSMPITSGPRACGCSSGRSGSSMEGGMSVGASLPTATAPEDSNVRRGELCATGTTPASCSCRNSSPCVTAPCSRISCSVLFVEALDELASDCSDSVGDGGDALLLVVLVTPFTVTETVSMLPAPLGPSMVSVLSDLSSPSPDAGVDVPVPLLLEAADKMLLFFNHGIGVSKAPPSDSSLPSPSRSVMPFDCPESPFTRKPPLGATACSCGSGKSEKGELTDTQRSSALRYFGRKR